MRVTSEINEIIHSEKIDYHSSVVITIIANSFYDSILILFLINVLDSRLRVLQGGTTKKDLITSLSVAKEDSIARLITSGNNPQSEEEAELASNPLIRHIAPHLQVSKLNIRISCFFLSIQFIKTINYKLYFTKEILFANLYFTLW